MITENIGLIDHHCHGVVMDELDPDGFRELATESDWLAADGLETLNTPFGLAIRAVCAPLLDLPRHAPVQEYIDRRLELGQDEVSGRLMGSAGFRRLLIDTGFEASDVASPELMEERFALPTNTIARLESIAESIAHSTTASSFASDFAQALSNRSRNAVGFKSISAYRIGLDIAPVPPSSTEVSRAADRWLARCAESGRLRIDDPVLISHIIWEAVGHQKPIQFHVGFGDSDVELFRSDPSRLTQFLRATRLSGATIMLLHTYPFTREAGSLAHIFPHVYLDVGEVSHYLGPSAGVALRHALELASFDKVLFSSDAYGLAEHYAVSAYAWRRNLGRLMDDWLSDDWISVTDAERLVQDYAAENAIRVYNLES